MRHVLLFTIGFAMWLPASGWGAEQGETVSLFNGKDFTGWTYHLRDGDVKMEDVWSVQDGVIVCQGKPAGYIRTKQAYENYKISFEWRWPERGGNSGLLVHIQEKDEVWPKSLEVQLASGHAGDFWVIGGVEIDMPNIETRRQGRRHLKHTDGAEKKIGEWNTMEVVCHGGKVVVKVNDVLVNECSKSSVTKGTIGLQSEGTEVHFRNIKLTPLK